MLPSSKTLILSVSVASLIFLVVLGMLAATAGGANIWKGALRVGFWGAFAIGLIAVIGKITGGLA